MWQSAKGILLKRIPYAENRFILKIFTENEGVLSFSIRPDTKSGKGKNRSVLGQPLSIIEFEFVGKAHSDIHTARNIHLDYPFSLIPHDFYRQSIVMFMNELILQTIKLPLSDNKIYCFLKDSLLLLDNANVNIGNFPLWFIIQLSSSLGIGPVFSEKMKDDIFDLVTGNFVKSDAIPGVHLSTEMSEILNVFICSGFPPKENFLHKDRQFLLNFMLDYLSFHADFKTDFKSVQILNAIFK